MTAHQSITPIIYKTISGYEGYRFGEDGSVWSCWSVAGRLTDEWRQLRGTPSTHYGHTKVEVKFNGKRVMRSVHRLILEAFVGPCPPGLECCHGPGGKLDNSVGNLSWGTHQSNIRDKVRDGTQAVGERNHNSKITEVQAASAIQFLKTGMKHREIVERTGVPLHTIDKISTKKMWTYLYEDERWRKVLIRASGLSSSVRDA